MVLIYKTLYLTLQVGRYLYSRISLLLAQWSTASARQYITLQFEDMRHEYLP